MEFINYGICLVAMCAKTMEPETTYPKVTSSNPEGKSGLTDDSAAPWIPAEDDTELTVTITIAEEDTYIDSFDITGSENVDQVFFTVLDENDEVVCISITLSLYCTC